MKTHGDVACLARRQDALAERSKAVAQGAIPKGRGFEPHRRHFTSGVHAVVVAPSLGLWSGAGTRNANLNGVALGWRWWWH